MTTETKRKDRPDGLAGDKYFNLIEHAADGIAIIQDGVFKLVNTALTHISGYDKEELLGMPFTELLTPASQKLTLERYQARLAGKKVPQTYEIQAVTKDGQIRDIELNAALTEYNGRIADEAIVRDITERKQIEDKIRKTEQEKTDILNSMAEIVIFQDLEHHMLWVNKIASESAGLTHEQMLGRHCYEIWSQRNQPCVGCPVKKARQTGKPQKAEIATPDGRLWSVRGYPMRDESGVITGMLEVVLGLTERKQAEEAIRQSEEKYRNLYELAPYAIVTTDKKGFITSCNATTLSYTGYSEDEIVGKHFTKLGFHKPSDIPKYMKIFNSLLKGKVPEPFEVNYTTKDGASRWVQARIGLLEARDKNKGFQLAFEDITERKQAEEEIVRLAKFPDENPSPVMRIAQDGIISYANKAALPLLNEWKCQVGQPLPKYWHKSISGVLRSGSKKEVEINVGKQILSALFAPVADKGYVNLYGLDITERKRAEQALADEATRRRILIDQSLDGIVVLDENAKVYEANQKFAEMLGYIPEEVRELHTWDWDKNFPPEQLLEMGRKVDEKGLRLETKHHRKDGSIIDVDISINGAVIAGQKLIFCVCRDITDRKKAEEALQAEKNKLQSLIDAMEDDLGIQDKDYNIIYQNEPSKKNFGDHLGEKCYQAYEGRDEVCPGCPVKKAFKDGKSHTSERRVLLPSGEIAYIETTANPVRDASEEIVACLEVGRDITERKRAEQALADEATWRRILVDQSLDGIVVLDENGKVYEANQKFAEMLGYSSEEARQLNVFDWEYLFPREQVLEMIRTVDEAGYHIETQHRRKDGSVYDVEISGNGAVIAGQKLIFCVCRDITERKKAEQALQTERNKLQSVIGAMEYDLTIQDKDYNIIYQNEPSRLSSGGDRLGEKCYWAYEGRDKICDGCPVEKAFKDGKSHTTERSHVLPSGEIAFYENTANPIRDASGEIVSCLEIGRNITERKNMEKQLQEKNEELDAQNEELKAINEELQATEEELQHSQERLERMFESATDGIVVTTLDGTVLKVNERAAQMIGYAAADELLGKNCLDCVAPGDREKMANNMQKVIKEGLIKRQEYTLRKADGTEFPAELSTNIIKDASGNAIGLITIARDITERKQMEQLFKTVTNSSQVGIYIIQDGKFQMANPQFQKLTGFTEEELLDMDSLALVLDEDKDKVREEAIKMLKGERSSPYQFRVVNKAGETRWVMETVTSIPYRGRRAILGNYMDITERRQAEEREDQLQQELNLASRLASIGQLAAGVAHEINNPLTGVIGFSHLMLSRDISDDMKKDLQVIHSEAQRVAKIVENLLVFAHQRKTGREYVSINDIITRVLELRAYEMKVNNIEVESQLDPDLPLTMADAGQFQQVFLNIILNAEYFMTKAHNKGKLLVKTEKIDGNIRASFIDDGTGISKENMDKIFNPFFTTKEVGKGTGLGLSICHGIITQHKGRIYAQSQLGKGATFVIELPIVAEPAQAGKAKATKPEPQKPRGAKILVVDDEEAILAFLSRLLSEWGHSVETINNADTALEKLNEERYSLVLLDIKLPGMSGIELYQHIEDIAPALARRVMFITGDIMEGTTRAFLEKTGAPYITKPLDIEVLKKTINYALNQTQVTAKASG
jgi:PAS domain S-box-containing protein